jgi:hypothetical protein
VTRSAVSTRPTGFTATAIPALIRHRAGRRPIRFIGVWDNGSALGIPLNGVRLVNLINRRWQFHDTKLTKTVAAAFQALAIDELRGPFRQAIWAPDHAERKQCEQVWFGGCHCDVGGGYPAPTLAHITLLWMGERARQCGLVFEPHACAPLGPGVALPRCTTRGPSATSCCGRSCGNWVSPTLLTSTSRSRLWSAPSATPRTSPETCSAICGIGRNIGKAQPGVSERNSRARLAFAAASHRVRAAAVVV